MKEIYLYHGSACKIQTPEYGFGNLYNDFGRGFYCTKDIELAKEWASGENLSGYVNKYKIDLNNLKILNLFDEKYNILHWLALLLNYRSFNPKSAIAKKGKDYLLNNYLIDINKYDLIIGYRADDSYFTFAKDFLNNIINIKQLDAAMKLGDLKEQYVLISKKSFTKIKFISSEKVDNTIYYKKRKMRDDNARNNYYELQNSIDTNGIYIRDIITGVKIDGKSL